jgi:hypothetical protein
MTALPESLLEEFSSTSILQNFKGVKLHSGHVHHIKNIWKNLSFLFAFLQDIRITLFTDTFGYAGQSWSWHVGIVMTTKQCSQNMM